MLQTDRHTYARTHAHARIASNMSLISLIYACIRSKFKASVTVDRVSAVRRHTRLELRCHDKVNV